MLKGLLFRRHWNNESSTDGFRADLKRTKRHLAVDYVMIPIEDIHFDKKPGFKKFLCVRPLARGFMLL